MAIYGKVRCAYEQNAFSIQLKRFNSDSADGRQWYYSQTIRRPDEVFRPVMLTRIEERNSLTCFLIERRLFI